MEAALELEDDVFYKDLSKQISLLIMDDDDEDSLAHCPSVNLQAFTQAIHPARQASFLNYDNYQQTNRRESSKGTGVFIPRSSHPRRKNNAKQARFTASANKFQTPCDHNSRGLPHMAYSSNINPSHSHDHYYSVNLRRF
ncbi:hypothetical protein DH2020_035927 [Rehmannia glutinosa]|uniref:Uncharacterized protein n=1 Tax=Rehmannia glutinosa TaxID=99300 RepID=A0ABR0V7B1_REHGL